MAFDREIAAMTAFCEASSLSPQARRAIVHSMFNRVRDGRFGKTVAAVCLKAQQFSEFNDDPADNRNLLRVAVADDEDPILHDCLDAYDEAMSNYPDPSNGATHFYDKSIPEPYWAKGATQTAHIDSLVFFKDVK